MNIKPMPPLTTVPKTAALRWQTRLGLLAQRLLGTMLLIVIAWVLRDQPVAPVDCWRTCVIFHRVMALSRSMAGDFTGTAAGA
ncbi:hypothetical protein [Chromatium okenii]|uniref:Uncharacterized protein n=1 Tax=Chromatium okenii TaxID=61644 RepID=A0A2S7XRL7_9GAMM|nr:hypothetical protein [Chromatium okenii]PQJ96051.1 hypothetical protein CXB77_09465 [Chromatium okenii]